MIRRLAFRLTAVAQVLLLALSPALAQAQTTPDVRAYTYTYTASGLVDTVDGPLPGPVDVVDYDYDAAGNLTAHRDALGHQTQVTSIDGRGAPLSVVDPNGVATTYAYDLDGRVVEMVVDPGPAQVRHAFAYNEAGDLTRYDAPGGDWLSFTYDDARPLTGVANHRGESVVYAVNAVGDPTAVTVKRADGSIVRSETRGYDALGQLIQHTAGGGWSETYAYDKVGNLTAIMDGRGKSWLTAYDALDRPTTETDPEIHVQRAGYNGGDALTTFKDGRQLQTTRVVDGFGQVVSQTSPDTGLTTFAYDAAGRMARSIDADGVERTFSWDVGDRLTGVAYPAASAQNIVFTYDQTAGGNRGVGRLTRVVDPSGSTDRVYDAQGRLVRSTQAILANTYVTETVYDASGAVATLTLPSGRIVSYTRAAGGEITAISTRDSPGAAPVALASAVTHQPFGEGLAGLTYGNGLTLARSYDASGLLSRITVAGGPPPVLDVGFTRHGDGRAASVIDHTPGAARSATFAYSDDGRLTSAGGRWGQDTYAYDAAGNRISRARTAAGTTTTEFSVVASGSNRLLEVRDAAQSVKRDLSWRPGGALAADNRTGEGVYAYTYDPAGRLTTARKDGVIVGQYGYDWTGRRVWRGTLGAGPIARDYVYDEGGRLLAEHDGATGLVVREYVWLDDMPLAVLDASPGGAAVWWVHAGRLDEPLAMTDGSGAVVWSQVLEPFGAAAVFGGVSAALDLRLPGQAVQLETGGLHQNWMRDYDPTTGRYITPDPLGLAAGQNLYAYVSGDPVNAVDPEGLQSVRQNNSNRSQRNHLMTSTSLTPAQMNWWTPPRGTPGRNVSLAGIPSSASYGPVQARQADINGVCLAPNQPGHPHQRYFSRADRDYLAQVSRMRCPGPNCNVIMTRLPGRPNTLTADHLIAYSRGGPTEFWNMGALCLACNASKGNRYPWEWSG